MPVVIASFTGCVSQREVDEQILILESGSPDEKKIAAEKLVEFSSSKTVEPLLRSARHESVETRRVSAWALGEIGDPRAALPLVSILEQDREEQVKESAAKALVKLKPEDTVEPLIGNMTCQDVKARELTIWALGMIGDEKAIPPLIYQGFNDKEDVIQRASVESVVKFSPESIPPLIGALTDYNGNIKQNSGNALVKIGNDAVNPVIDALYSDNTELQAQSAYVLGEIHHSDAIKPLINILDDYDIQVRRASVRALAKFGDTALGELEKEVDNDNPLVKESIADAFGMMASEKSIPCLQKLLDDEDVRVRTAAVFALGRLQSTQTVPKLVNALKDPHWNVRKTAADALKKIGWTPSNKEESAFFKMANQEWNSLQELKENAVQPLIIALEDDKEWVRKSAAETLSQIGDPVYDKLMVLLNSDNSRLKGSVVEIMGNIGDPRAIAPISKLLSDKEWIIRKQAAEALAKIKDPKTIGPLSACLADQEKLVRRAALEAMGKIGDAKALPIMKQSMRDEEWIVRKNLAEALEKICGHEATIMLLELVKDKHDLVRKSAGQTLEAQNWKPKNETEHLYLLVSLKKWREIQKKGDKAFPVLMHYVNDISPQVRKASAELLGEINSAEIVPVLLRLLQEDDYLEVREAAAHAIARKGQGMTDSLIEILENGDPLARKLSAESLGDIKYE